MKDQAEGLRQLFAATVESPTACLIACPAREAAALPFSRALVDSFAREGHPLLWIDEIDFRYREGFPLASPVKFHLSQWMAGDVSLRDVVVGFGERQWFAYSGEDLPSPAPTSQSALEQFQQSGLETEVVVASITQGTSLLPALKGHPLHVALVCDAKPQQLRPTLAAIARLESGSEIASVSLVLCGAEADCTAFQKAIEDVSTGFVGTSPEVLGKLDLKLMSAPLATIGRAGQPLADRLASRILHR